MFPSQIVMCLYPPLDIDLDNEALEVLQHEVDPLLESSCHGVDLYQHALQIVQE